MLLMMTLEKRKKRYTFFFLSVVFSELSLDIPSQALFYRNFIE